MKVGLIGRWYTEFFCSMSYNLSVTLISEMILLCLIINGRPFIKDLSVFLPSSKIWSSTIFLNIWSDTEPSVTKCSPPHFRYLVHTSSISSVEQWWLIHSWQWLILGWSPKETEVLQFAEITWHKFLLDLWQVLSL